MASGVILQITRRDCVFEFFGSVFFSSRRRHTSYIGDWSSDVCSSDLRDRDVRSRLHGRWDVNKQRVLFLCAHNSARSQMAEGLLRSLAGDRFDVASAGTEATRVHPLAIRAMADVGIDLSRHTSKSVETLLDQPWDHDITVCDSANERCPIFPKPTHRLHWSFPDPSQARDRKSVV